MTYFPINNNNHRHFYNTNPNPRRRKQLPTERVPCDCKEHLKHVVFDEVIQGLDVKQYFELHFGQSGAKFMEDVQKQRGATGKGEFYGRGMLIADDM